MTYQGDESNLADIETVFNSWDGVILTVNSSTVSMAASILVISLILRSVKGLARSVYHRILFGMSITDIIQSFAMALTTLPMPKDMIYTYDSFVLGNRFTCTVQGLTITFGTMTTIAYNGILSFYYLCSICYDMSDDEFKRRFEWKLHVTSVVIGMTCVFITLMHDGIVNPAPTEAAWCRPSNYPYWCSGEECYGVDMTQTYAFNFFSLIGMLAALVIVVSMVMIVKKVNKQEQQVQNTLEAIAQEDGVEHPTRTYPHLQDSHSFRDTKAITKQAFTYTFINLLNITIVIIRAIIRSYVKGAPLPALQSIYLVLRPIQGLLNATIFVYHKAHDLKKERPHISCFHAVHLVLKGEEARGQVLSNMLIVRRDEQFSRLHLACDNNPFDEDVDHDGDDLDDDSDRINSQNEEAEDEGSREADKINNSTESDAALMVAGGISQLRVNFKNEDTEDEGSRETNKINISTKSDTLMAAGGKSQSNNNDSSSNDEPGRNISLAHTPKPSVAQSEQSLSGFSDISSTYETKSWKTTSTPKSTNADRDLH